VIPNLDSEIGITVYSTDFNGIGGKIRVEPEDFQVTELISQRAQNSINDQEGYAVYKLKKKKIDTNHALSDVFRKKGIRLSNTFLKGSKKFVINLGSSFVEIPSGYIMSPVCQITLQSEFASASATSFCISVTFPVSPTKQKVES